MILDKKNIFLAGLTIILIVGFAFFIAIFSLVFLVIFLGLLIIAGVFLNIDWGIYLLFGSLVAGQLIRLPLPFGEGGVLLSDVLTGVVLAAWILKKLILKERFNTPFLMWPIFGFITVAIFSLAVNRVNITFDEFLASGFYLIRWIEYVGIYFVVSDLVSADSPVGELQYKRARLSSTFLVTAVVLSVLGFIQLKLFSDFSPMTKYGWDPHVGRLLSTWFDPNFLGGFLVIGLMLSIAVVLFYYYSDSARQKKLTQFTMGGLTPPFLSIVVVIIFTALILTYSRSSYLSFLVGFFIMVFTFILINRNKKGFLAVILLLVIIPVVLAVIAMVLPRVEQRIQGAKSIDVTARARINSWKRAWGAIEDNYLIGVGYNTIRYTGSISVSKLHSAGGSDSSLLTIWLTTGIIGLLFYLWILASIIKKSFYVFSEKNNPLLMRAIGLGVLGAIFSVLIHSMFVNSLLYPHIMLGLWLIVGLL